MDNLLFAFLLLVFTLSCVDGQCKGIRTRIYQNNGFIDLRVGRKSNLSITFFERVQSVQVTHAKNPQNGKLSEDGTEYVLTGGFTQRKVRIHVQGKLKLKSLMTNSGVNCTLNPPECTKTDFGDRKCKNILNPRVARNGRIRSAIRFKAGNNLGRLHGAVLTFGFDGPVNFHAYRRVNREENSRCLNLFNYRTHQKLISNATKIWVKYEYPSNPARKLVYVAFGDGICRQECGVKPECMKPTTVAPMTTVAPNATVAPMTTVAPATTVALMTTVAPATTVAPMTTVAPATTIAPMTTVAPATTVAPTETEAPETEAPATEAPETEAPETEAPETEAPETEAPETEAPETEAPETEAPETEAPETEAPETEAPETEAPETEAPETEAPETEAPETEAPETEAPETEAPETEAPETEAPETEAPETEAPETQAPETEAPETEAPETEAPETEAPETEAPETEAPKTEAPGTEAPVTEAPEKRNAFKDVKSDEDRINDDLTELSH